MMPCSLLSCNRRLGGTYRLHLQGRKNKFRKNQQVSRWQADPEDGRDMFLGNVGCNSTDYRQHIPENDNLHNHPCENLNSYIYLNKL
jgi:hypothetical protein